jgi:hypothetical protein
MGKVAYDCEVGISFFFMFQKNFTGMWQVERGYSVMSWKTAYMLRLALIRSWIKYNNKKYPKSPWLFIPEIYKINT